MTAEPLRRSARTTTNLGTPALIAVGVGGGGLIVNWLRRAARS